MKCAVPKRNEPPIVRTTANEPNRDDAGGNVRDARRCSTWASLRAHDSSPFRILERYLSQKIESTRLSRTRADALIRTYRRLLGALFVGLSLLVVGCSDGSSPTGPGTSDPSGSGGGDNGGGGTAPSFNSEVAPGDSAHAFLTDENFSILAVEVDYMEGYEPTPAALDSLKTSLNTHLNKSSIVLRSPTQIPAEGDSVYTTDQIRTLEDTHRDHYTRAVSDTLWAHFLVVDGEFEQQNVLGIAYFNTSMAFFGKTIDDVTTGLGAPSREKVEATVFRHEFGHNLGLVNNGTPMEEDHHDEANGPHCTEEQCVMYHAIETTNYFANVFDGTVPSFEAFCTADMAAQRE